MNLLTNVIIYNCYAKIKYVVVIKHAWYILEHVCLIDTYSHKNV